jgi:cell division transport system permease protein
VRLRFVLSEMTIGLRRNLSMTVAVILTVAIGLGLLGGAWLVSRQINTMKDYWFGKIQVSVFLEDSVTQPERDAIRQQLLQLPQVQQVFYESKQEAYQHFKQQFKSVPALVKNTDPSALPESFRVKLKDPKQFQIVASAVQNMPGVNEVADESGALKRFFRILDFFQNGGAVLALLSMAAAILMVFNTVRLSAFSRRRETGIMRLVGASNFYIQTPFVLEGAVAGFVGSLLASLGLVAFKVVFIDHGVRVALGGIVSYIGWDTVIRTVPVLILLGVFLGAVTAFGTLQRYLRV